MSHLTEASKPSEPSGELDEGQQRESEDYDYDNENENAGESDDDLKAPEPVTEKPSTGSLSSFYLDVNVVLLDHIPDIFSWLSEKCFFRHILR